MRTHLQQIYLAGITSEVSKTRFRFACMLCSELPEYTTGISVHDIYEAAMAHIRLSEARSAPR